MNNRPFERAILSLSHPFVLLMIAILLINDYYLRTVAPSWWTGKISDVAWLAFAPFLVILSIAWLVPKQWHHRENLIPLIAFGFIGLGFLLAKTTETGNRWLIDGLQWLTGKHFLVVQDPTDLLTLPALLIGWYIWRSTQHQSYRLSLAQCFVAIAIGSMATVATSEPDPELGIFCLVNESDQILALTMPPSNIFETRDGGLSWQKTDQPFMSFDKCKSHSSTTFTDPNNSQNIYQFRIDKQVIRHSINGGVSWVAEYDLSLFFDETREESDIYLQTPYDFVIDSQTGNVILAMGHDGVLVRNAQSNKWQWVEVGGYGFRERRSQNIHKSFETRFPFIALATFVLVLAGVNFYTPYYKELSRIWQGLFLLWVFHILTISPPYTWDILHLNPDISQKSMYETILICNMFLGIFVMIAFALLIFGLGLRVLSFTKFKLSLVLVGITGLYFLPAYLGIEVNQFFIFQVFLIPTVYLGILWAYRQLDKEIVTLE